MPIVTNIACHLLQQEHDDDSHGLIDAINQLILASKIISKDINKAGLTSILGSTGQINVQQEEQQKLDAYADDLFIDILRQSPYVAAVATEEKPEIISFESSSFYEKSKYIVFMDPIDGSSNIDVNVSIGTNFVIFKKKNTDQKLTKEDYLQPGKNAVAAGYVVYGASTMLVYSIGKGVHGFTLDPSIGEFILSHPQIKIPDKLTYYSINEAYQPKWDNQTKQFIQELKNTGSISARYIGSLVADFHRNLLKGGIYLYPADSSNTQGKLRLMYEAIPFSYLAQQAGGYGSSGKQDILEIIPSDIHQRTPLIVGNTQQVKQFETNKPAK